MNRLDVEVKLAPDGEGVFEGYASVFGGEPDSVGDIVEAGAFVRSIAEHKASGSSVLMLWQHRVEEPIGTWESIAEDARGLAVRGRLVLGTARGREAFALLKSGALNGLSIGYRVRDYERRAAGGRNLRDVELIEISLVTLPASSAARITSVKSAALGAAQHPRKAMDEENAPGEGIGERVAAVEEKVASIDTRLASVEEAVAATKKSAERIEAKLNRPGTAFETKAKPGEIEAKSFFSYVRRGVEVLAPDEVKALRVENSTAGGYLAPDQFDAEILKNLVLYSPIRSVARVANTSSGAVNMPARTGMPNARWVGETDARPASEPTYAQLRFEVCELATYVDVSNALLEDAAFDIAGELARDLGEDFGKKEGSAFVSGVGAPSPTGILNAGIATVNNGHATDLKHDAILDLYHALPSPYAANAVWGMNRTTIGTVRKLKDGSGRPMWIESLADGNPPTIMGRPVIEMPDLPDIASGVLPIVFGDFSNYRIFDRVSLSVLRDPYSVQTQGLVRFHARRRVAAGVAKKEAFRFLKMAV